MTNFEKGPKTPNLDYLKWAEALDSEEIFGPMYYVNENRWYLDVRLKENYRNFDVFDLDGVLPDYLRRIPIPQEVVRRFDLRTPEEPPYFIH